MRRRGDRVRSHLSSYLSSVGRKGERAWDVPMLSECPLLGLWEPAMDLWTFETTL